MHKSQLNLEEMSNQEDSSDYGTKVYFKSEGKLYFLYLSDYQKHAEFYKNLERSFNI